ncbi:MAG: hypothetical protein HOV68_02880, partial [Streptomycetaceae bacterium]|nr:hypothetical protein [Streptomycetaceae bacterium]
PAIPAPTADPAADPAIEDAGPERIVAAHRRPKRRRWLSRAQSEDTQLLDTQKMAPSVTDEVNA